MSISLYSSVSLFLFKRYPADVIFIVPLWDIIAGPVNGHGMHCCLAPRMWNGHYAPSLHEDLEEINCSSLCITDSEEVRTHILYQEQYSGEHRICHSYLMAVPQTPVF